MPTRIAERIAALSKRRSGSTRAAPSPAKTVTAAERRMKAARRLCNASSNIPVTEMRSTTKATSTTIVAVRDSKSKMIPSHCPSDTRSKSMLTPPPAPPATMMRKAKATLIELLSARTKRWRIYALAAESTERTVTLVMSLLDAHCSTFLKKGGLRQTRCGSDCQMQPLVSRLSAPLHTPQARARAV